jgi:16S rRNA G966 N2-methylase RsmD
LVKLVCRVENVPGIPAQPVNFIDEDLGDSLAVMNSLLSYERLGGQVQMIYMDPPYGVKFGSNFQPFIRKRDVKHNDDADMTREPEMVKAYRDTWELGMCLRSDQRGCKRSREPDSRA